MQRQGQRVNKRGVAFALGAGLSLVIIAGTAILWMALASARLQSGHSVARHGDDLTILVAGRDVAYCGYRLRCKDQNQRHDLFQGINTDTLMVVKLSGSRLDVLNIPRDTNVGEFNPELGLSEQKVNSQYQAGGPQRLRRAVEEITGGPIDRHVILNEDFVAEAVTALGGLDVDVPSGGIRWKDEAAGVDLDLAPGQHHLTGHEAVWYLRVRKGVGDDWGRIDHQKQAITQLLGRLRSAQGLRAVPTLLNSFSNSVETDLDPEALAALAPRLSDLKVNFATLPTAPIRGTFNLAADQIALAEVWSNPYLDTLRRSQRLQREVSGETEPESGPSVLQTPVIVRDASGAEMGEALAAMLQKIGLQRVEVLTEAPSSTSQVLTGTATGAARELSLLLGFPNLQGDRFDVPAGAVVLLLGEDAAERLPVLEHWRRTPPSNDIQIH